MTNPTLVTTPFAENGDKNTIPQSVGAEPQNATQNEGFPEVTQTPISAGGIPPERKDFNGILNLYGQHIVHLNKGLPYEFDAAFATAIGGYPLYARIMLSNGDIVRNTVANNTNNPNSNMTGWEKQDLNNYLNYIYPEDYYLDSDNGDWLAAFQIAANKSLELGGAEILLTKKEYYLSQFTPDRVQFSLWRTNSALSKVFYVSPNTKLSSTCGGTVLLINGGSSSPWGWETATNVLVVGNDEDQYPVNNVDYFGNSVTVNSGDISNFSPNMRVQLYRLGGDYPNGTPRTPSRERAPCQIMTIDSISGSEIFFKEVFSHKFNTRGDLYLAKQKNSGEYPSNIFWDDVSFKSYDETDPYILFSRQDGGGFYNIKLDGCSGSYGMSQNFNGNKIEIYNKDFTIESVSGWNINTYFSEDQNSQSTNGVLINDNVINWSIQNFTSKGYGKTGALILFGVDGYISTMNIENCGINGTPSISSQEYTALVVGTLNNGFYGTKEVAESPAYLRKNLGENNLSIDKLNIKGFNKRPVLVCDSRLVVDNAYIEYDESGDTPIIHIGDSGKSRNDATYFTDNAHSEIIINKLDIVTKNKTELNFYDFVSQSFGVDGRLFAKPAKVAVSASASDTTLTVNDASFFNPYSQNVFFFPNTGSGIAATSKQVTEINGNVLTLSSTLGVDLAVNTEVWTFPPDSVGGAFNNCFVDIKNITVDGKRYPDVKIRPYKFISIENGATTTLSIPVSKGMNNLRLNIQDYGGAVGIPLVFDLIVNSATSGYSAIISQTKGNTSLNMAIDSIFMPNPNEVQIALKNNRGFNTRIYTTWDLI